MMNYCARPSGRALFDRVLCAPTCGLDEHDLAAVGERRAGDWVAVPTIRLTLPHWRELDLQTVHRLAGSALSINNQW